MYGNPRRLRRPEERVGNVTNADLPPPADLIEDAAIVDRIRRGDDAVFDHLLEKYYSAMLRVALPFVRSPEEAEEVIQDTWIAVLAGIDRFEGRSSFKTWMFRILINRARSRAKREHRTVPFSACEPTDAYEAEPWSRTQADETSSPEQDVLNAELRHSIERAISTLPRLQRMVITLRDVEGWTAQEVCDTLAISAANQRVSLHRARMHVRERLAPYLDSARKAT